jgi:hypothetical protein
MKINELKDLINSSREQLPISFDEIIYKENKIWGNSKLVVNNKFKDKNYSIFGFYKSISRF